MDTIGSIRERHREEELLKVANQAAAWLIALEEADTAADRAAFAAWIEESPLHVEMFLQVSAIARLGDQLTVSDRAALVERVLARDHESGVVHWSDFAPGDESASSPEPRQFVTPRAGVGRSIRWAAGIAAVCALTAIGLWLFIFGPLSWTRYSTAIGEQRTVSLRDGSVVFINADSRVAVRYSRQFRQIQLSSGEALFVVAHDPSRPFQVQVGDSMVQAVGTQFNIYRRSLEATVAVIEGTVRVTSAADVPRISEEQGAAAVRHAADGATRSRGPRARQLTAGEALTLSAHQPLETPVAVNVTRVTAWRQRRLVFEWETLDAIAHEFNHYNRTPQIVIEGDDIKARRYTAVFDADNPQALLKFLAANNDLAFAAEGNNFVIRGR